MFVPTQILLNFFPQEGLILFSFIRFKLYENKIMFIECISFKLEVSKECQIKRNLKEAKWKNYHAKIVQQCVVI